MVQRVWISGIAADRRRTERRSQIASVETEIQRYVRPAYLEAGRNRQTLKVAERALADYFEAAVQVAGTADAKPVCNWIATELLGRLNAAGKTMSHQ